MDKSNLLLSSFSGLEDPRAETHSRRHLLSDILTLTILAVICNADTWVAIERFGRSKEGWLKTFLELPNGIPSHDTLGDLFSRLDPKQLQACFLDWVAALFKISDGEIIAIDGKTLRGSYDTASSRGAIHMVNAWACKNGVTLGQYKTAEKSNEITAIPELLKVLNLKGNIITIDAMGCQKAIAAQIVEQEGDYVFNLKANQTSLHQDVELFFTSYLDKGRLQETSMATHEVIEGDHGRVETRRYWLTQDIGWLSQAGSWTGLKSIGLVEYESIDKSSGEITTERRYFISSLSADAKQFAQAVRLHWGVESMHWCLDVGFNEDACRVRKDYGPENLAVIRQIALNLLKQETTAKVGIKTKRLMAGWDHAYLAKLLQGGTNV